MQRSGHDSRFARAVVSVRRHPSFARLLAFLAMALLPAWLSLSAPCLAAGAPAAGNGIGRYAAPAEEAPYQPDPAAIEALRRIDIPVTIILFHGTWCKDCRREVPRFLTILRLAGNPNFRLVDYEVNPQKQDALGKFEQYGISRVPTFIFLSGDKELGRIVETPRQSLEQDFLAIVGPSQ